MKRLFFLIAIILLHYEIFSQVVPQSEAKNIAKNARKFIERGSKNDFIYKIRNFNTKLIDNEPGLHFVNFEDSTFMVISGDSTLSPILVFGKHCFFNEAKLPDALSFLIENYELQIKENRKNKIRTDEKAKKKWDSFTQVSYDPGPGPVEEFNYMIPTNWHQGSTFNRYCPSFMNQQALAGCVAVSMAQVIAYWACLTQPTGSHSYICPTIFGSLSANFGTANYDWDAMHVFYGDPENAKLIFHCGVAVEMNYGLNVSDIADCSVIEPALESYFGFKTSTQYKQRIWHLLSWKNMLIEEINMGRPIIYNGKKHDYLNDRDVGHSWIIDGYEPSTDQFHLNLGWEDYLSNNVWYSLEDVPYPDHENAIVGIEPERNYPIGSPSLLPQSILPGSTIISIPPIPGATTYEWTATPGTISGTGSSASLTTTTSSMVCVRGYNSKCETYSDWDCEIMTVVNPEIVGPDILCQYGSGYVLQNYYPGSSITWAKSQNVKWIGDPYGSTAIIEANTTNSEYGWIQASLGEMGPPIVVIKNFWLGKPLIPTIAGPTTIDCAHNYGYNIPFNSVQNSTNTTWSKTGPLQIVAQTNQGCTIYAPSGGSGTLTATLSNCNGDSQYSITIQALCDAPMAYPNPANDILYVDPNNMN